MFIVVSNKLAEYIVCAFVSGKVERKEGTKKGRKEGRPEGLRLMRAVGEGKGGVYYYERVTSQSES